MISNLSACRRVLTGLLVFSSLLCILVGATPYILSTRYGLSSLCSMINAISKFKVSISNADVRWRTKHPFVEGFKLAYNRQLMTIDRAYATKSIWRQVTRNHKQEEDRTRVFVQNPKISAEVDRETGIFWLAKVARESGLDLGPKPLCDELDCEEIIPTPIVPKEFQSDVVDESFSAEIVLDRVDVFVSDGVLKMPKAMKDVLGGRLFVDVSLQRQMDPRQLTVEKSM